jgi:Holliday junction DNA helicase RuvB
LKKSLDSALRPKKWDNYIGQERIKKNLKIMIEAARKEMNLGSFTFLWPAGLGKTLSPILWLKSLEAK